MGTLVAPNPLVFRCATKIGECTLGRLSSYADLRQGAIKGRQTCFVQFNVDPIARMDPLDVRFVAVARRIKSRPPKRLREIGGEAEVVMGVQIVLEGVGGFRVSQTQFVPALGQRKNTVEAATVLVECHSGHFTSYHASKPPTQHLAAFAVGEPLGPLLPCRGRSSH